MPNEVLALCLHELGSLLDDDALFLAPLTTTHGEAVLLTSTAQRGGLREVVAQGGVWDSGLATLSTKHARSDRGQIFIWGEVLRSNDPYVGFEPSPRACRGGGVERF
jgi:hypothetical protein